MKPVRTLFLSVFFSSVAALGLNAETRREPPGPGYEVMLSAEEELTQMYLSFYLHESRRKHVLEALERAESYREMVMRHLREEGLPFELFYLPMIESEYNPSAVSPAGAVGLWQLMPRTARLQGLKVTAAFDERLDPEKSTRAALRHLKALRARLGNWPMALAAYNCGTVRLRTLLAKGRSLPRETRHFVPKLRAAILVGEIHMVRNEDAASGRSFDLHPIEDTSRLEIAMLSPSAAVPVLRDLSPHGRPVRFLSREEGAGKNKGNPFEKGQVFSRTGAPLAQ